MKLFEYINKDELNNAISDKSVKIIKHPVYPISLISYTKNCCTYGNWNDTTMKCRGLVYDNTSMDIICIPMRKFFNIEEGYNIHETEDYTIFDKLDGTLCILFFYNGEPIVCTKGAFDSVQSKLAKSIIRANPVYKDSINSLDTNYTYMFELISPADRHVVDYGAEVSMIFIACTDNRTAEDMDIRKINNLYGDIFRIPTIFESVNWHSIRDQYDGENKEGFVIRFSNGNRIKLKFNEYWHKYGSKNMLSERKLIKMKLVDIQFTEAQLESFDEETRLYKDKLETEIEKKVSDILYDALIDYDDTNDIDTIISEFKKSKYRNILFRLLKSNDIIDVRKNIYRYILTQK